MNFIDLIPSKDIKEYLKNINYKLTISDVFWLIYEFSSTLDEKHMMFNKMFEEYKDEKVEYDGYENADISSSYYELTKKLIDKENKELEDFIKADIGKFVFKYSIEWFYNDKKKVLQNSISDLLFNTYGDCLDFIKCEGKKYIFQLEDCNTIEIANIKIEKIKIGNEITCLNCVFLNKEYKPTRIMNDFIKDIDNDFMSFFEYGGLFTIPTPFKEGDIVVLKYDKEHPLLLINNFDYAAKEDFEAGYMDKNEYNERLNKNYDDCFNMKFVGYELYENGIITKAGFDEDFGISPMGYLSLEYYNDENNIDITILEKIKLYLKKSISLYELLDYYKNPK